VVVEAEASDDERREERWKQPVQELLIRSD
jgi:hypothetical protein